MITRLLFCLPLLALGVSAASAKPHPHVNHKPASKAHMPGTKPTAKPAEAPQPK